jgi:hypothetical protein
MQHPTVSAYLLPAFTLCICLGCKEYYVPDIDPQADVLIVEGIINDIPGPDSIMLSRGLPYDGGTRYPAVPGASITIFDSENAVEHLVERSPGKYYTSDDFMGSAGKSYVLQIETNDGHVYRSDTVTIMPVPTIDSMYTEYNEIEFLQKNLNGEYIRVSDPGMDIYFDIPEIQTENLYLKFEWVASIQYMVYISFPLESVDDYRTAITSSRISTNNSVVNIINPADFNSRDLPANHLAFFGMSQMVPTVDPVPGGTIKGRYTYGLVIFAWLQSIDEAAFRYWESIEKQIYAEGKLFDPVTTQIYGNLECVSDPSRLVLGYFAASSVSNHAFYAYLRSDNSIYSRQLDIDPDTLEIRHDSILPPIWIWPEH